MFFSVDFEDGVEIGTVASNAIRVVGPNGYNQLATDIGVAGFDSVNRTHQYELSPNGNYWGVEDNGTYSVIVEENTVFDNALNALPGGIIGTFELDLPIVAL